MSEIPSRYNPKETEDKWYKFWEKENFFSANPNPAKKPFCIVIPPPNVTGILHIGHALNNTLQDILIRYHRMKGEEALWMPGTDHAGIATQNVVEKAIAKEGLKRQDLGREKFLEKVWLWKEEYGSTIIHQLKKIGASCDWPRRRFTMDKEYSKAIIEAFIRLYKKGLIYQGSYIINWCPRCQTALSDEEAPHCQIQGNLYYLRYPFAKNHATVQRSEVNQGVIPAPVFTGVNSAGIQRGYDRIDARFHGHDKNGKRKLPEAELLQNHSIGQQPTANDYIIVATTRPETMLGDTAVAVNPKDKKYKKLIGKTLILPLINREIKIIADEMIDMDFGTGAVKVTPAHDPNDYELAKKHGLEFINIMHPDGRLNLNAGDYNGMDRFKAREVILEDLKELGCLEKVQPHPLSAGHCYRCHTIIEPYLSKQWFVKMKPLAEPAIEAVKKGKIKFYPSRWMKVYLNWMENIQDWCISRQIWWGHRIPVYYCKNCQETGIQKSTLRLHSGSMVSEVPSLSRDEVEPSKVDEGIIVSAAKPDKCPVCGSVDIYQDEDVLDTWFSSWLWPFATFGWPFSMSRCADESAHRLTGSSAHRLTDELAYFYPTSVLVTAPEIIFFWVARMIMAGFEFMKEIPFKDVYIHGTVRDIEGKKMSKSLGNIIDPLEIINEYGTDAMRFSLISITSQGQDVFLSKERFEQGRNFANKIWNASRFILMNLEETTGTSTDLCAFFKKEDLGFINRWILSRFYSTLKEATKYLEAYKFNEAANSLYAFFWHEFCDWYLELAKPIMVNKEQSEENKNTQIVMHSVLEKSLRALHPFMPFITEEIWQALKKSKEQEKESKESIMIQSWPHIQEQMIDKKIEKQAQVLFDVIKEIRNLRSSIDLKPDQKVIISVYPHTKPKYKLIEDNTDLIANLAKLEALKLLTSKVRPIAAISAVTGDIDLYLHFSGLLDINKERDKINKKINEMEKHKNSKEQRIKNPEFLKKAPEEIVKREEESIEELTSSLRRLAKMR
ncbi:MAG: valine--tRNA ligase, partial [Candidatus Omnitrophota bacterium]|nr:valine--tRNA ligase [Candidatus Omnitrophota bacterium]